MTRFSKPSGLGWVVARLRGWQPLPSAAERHLLPRFAEERRGRFIQIYGGACAAMVPFYSFFVLTDLLLYREHLGTLLVLRTLLVSLCGGMALVLRLPAVRRHSYRIATGFFTIGISILVLMVHTTQEPGGIYTMALVGAIPLVALLPAPPLWYVRNALAVLVLYCGGMLLGGTLLSPTALQMAGALAGTIVFFGVAQRYLEAQRWESFLNRTRSEELSRRLQGELAMARRIQQSLLPPARPTWPSADLACWSEPAREVGGDFYAYTRLPDGRVGLAVGDVSGKGMPAALLMSTSLALLRGADLEQRSPAELLGWLDMALRDSTRATRQNCALCCVEIADGQARVANAGGIAPLLRRANGSVEWVDVGGLPLGTGLGGRLGYRDSCFTIAPGDMLLLVSDGVIEAMREDGEMFGFARFERAAAACDAPSAFVAIALLREAVAEFIGPAENHDDMTIVALRV